MAAKSEIIGDSKYIDAIKSILIEASTYCNQRWITDPRRYVPFGNDGHSYFDNVDFITLLKSKLDENISLETDNVLSTTYVQKNTYSGLPRAAKLSNYTYRKGNVVKNFK